jgi:purine-binding chemotaxis protein CheW
MGVINLRGKVIPVTDLRQKFNMAPSERTALSCIIVVDVGKIEMGIVVDSVSEVLDIDSSNIEDAPSFGLDVNTDFILGMGKTSDRVTILLDISKVLTGDELSAISAV